MYSWTFYTQYALSKIIFLHVWHICNLRVQFKILKWERTSLLHRSKRGKKLLTSGNIVNSLLYVHSHTLSSMFFAVGKYFMRSSCNMKKEEKLWVVRAPDTLDEQAGQCHCNLQPQLYPPINNNRYQYIIHFPCVSESLSKTVTGQTSG